MANWDITTVATPLEYVSATTYYVSCAKVDENHFINFFNESVGGDGFVQVFTVNTTTWAVTTAATALEYDTRSSNHNVCVKVDTNHFLAVWLGQAATTDAWAQVFTVNTTTWAVTTAAALKQFDTNLGSNFSLVAIDSNHFLNVWQSVASDGFAQVLTVDTTTWAVTTAAASLEFDTQNCSYTSSVQIDSNHFLIAWVGGAGTSSLAQVLTVNTTTWAVTTAAARLDLSLPSGGSPTELVAIDANHFLFAGAGTDNDGFAQVLTVDTTTWAVTTAAASLEFDTQNANTHALIAIDSNHFLLTWEGTINLDGFAQVLTVDTTTWAVTTAAASLEFDTQNAVGGSAIKIDSNHFLTFYSGGASSFGTTQVLVVELPSGTSVKTYMGLATASVKTVNGLAIASRKTWAGLA